MRVAALPSFKKLYRKIPAGTLKKSTKYELVIYICIHTHTHTHTHTHSYIDTYVYTYIHTYVYTYIHIYLHTHTHTGGQQPLPGGDVQREEVLCAVDDVVDWRAELFPGLRLHRRRRHLYCSCSGIPGQATHFAAQNGRCKISHFPKENVFCIECVLYNCSVRK